MNKTKENNKIFMNKILLSDEKKYFLKEFNKIDKYILKLLNRII
jgi:hypothetical protein